MVRHAVYRCEAEKPSRWRAYLCGTDLDTAGVTFDEVRQMLLRAYEESFDPREPLVEHVEHALLPGVYLRSARDRYAVERDEVSAVLRRCLNDWRLYTTLTSLASQQAETVVVTCLPHDPWRWISGQLEAGPLVLVTRESDRRVWWHTVLPGSGHAPTPGLAPHGLARWGLDDHAFVSDLVAACSPGEITELGAER